MSSPSGLSQERLSRMHALMSGFVERGEVPGIITLLSRNGETHVDVVGSKSIGGEALHRDSIFRITSMTKPITAVATMILVEQCKLRLDDPIERWLPELADRRVLKRIDGPLDDTVPAHRAITLRDLLTFRQGFGLIMQPSSDWPIQKAIDAAQLNIGPPKPRTPHSPDEWLRRLGTLPLMYQPGERWMYNVGTHILSVLIARASGQSLDAFFHEHLFEPLGMKDTSFVIPSEKRSRFVSSYWVNEKTGALELHDGVEDSVWNSAPAFPDGTAGLVSTVDDYLAFAKMMLNGGKLGNERILSRLSIEAMTTDQLTAEQKATSAFVPGYWDTRGWGFGIGILTARDGSSSVPGRYGWDGGYGTSWGNDPREDMISILFTQRGGFPLSSPVWLDFWTAAYQAIDD